MSAPVIAPFEPITVAAVDLDTGRVEFPDPERPTRHRRARVLVRWLDQPLGILDVEGGPDELLAVVTEAAWAQLRPAMARVATATGAAAPACVDDLVRVDAPAHRTAVHGQLISVAIPTLRNTDALVRCVRRMLQGHWRDVEIVVADNDDDPEPVEAALKGAFGGDPRVRWVHEPRRGASYARNAAMRAARGEIIVFADDDVQVDHFWLERLVTAFDAAPGVGCVTGAILPAELETQPQAWIEEYGGFHKGFERQVFNLTSHRRQTALYPYDAGQFGSGANMAYRREVVEALGGFKLVLGPGTPTHGGEDLDLLWRTVSAGHTVVYEPAAVVWHSHRRSHEALRMQMFRYGVGLSATLTRWMLAERRALDIARRAAPGLLHLVSPTSRKNGKKSGTFPRRLTALEYIGFASGPIAYLRSARIRREP